jgi:hypothetical protein
MHKLLRRMLVVLAGLGGITPVGAGAVELPHIPLDAPVCLSVNAPAPCNGSGGGASFADYSFSFDLSGVVGADEVITAATLSLYLSDDRGSSDGSDKLDLFLDLVDMQVTGDVQNDLVLPLIDLSLLGDGLLHVQLLAQTGDFFFEGASLTPTVEDREQDPGSDPIETTTTAVPVPAPLVLVGLGLVALAARRRA